MKILTNKKYNDILEKCKILDNNVFNLKQCLHRKEIEHIEELVSKNQCIIKLKEQLEYLRNGEYYNQLRFERDMLENLVLYGEVSKEDKEFIDMTHRNTELLEENQKYKEVIEKAMLYINSTRYSDITGLEKHPIKEFWFIEELLDILKEVK